MRHRIGVSTEHNDLGSAKARSRCFDVSLISQMMLHMI